MKILIIRRDNIGDLVCTTPLISALRRQLPEANIQALVTHYNADVLAGNTELTAIHSYQKAKHRAAGEGRFAIYWDRLRTILHLRRTHFDWVLLPGGAQASSLRFANMVAPKRLLIRDSQDNIAGPHEVEQCCHLLTRMGLQYEAPPAIVTPAPDLSIGFALQIAEQLGFEPRQLVGVHISARKVSQRWPTERFAEVIRALTDQPGTACLLFWAPGRQDDAKHPGDDEKAADILRQTSGLPVVALPTQGVDQLIAAISQCDTFICADGGAMHLAAALGKPMVCLFGDSDPDRWGPWYVNKRILQSNSRDVRGISFSDVLTAWNRLIGN